MTLCSTSHPLDGQLFEAIAELDLSHCKALLEAGAQASAVDAVMGKTALIAALQTGNQELVQLLIAQGADVNGRSDRGLTPLMQAASQCHLEFVSLLLEQGAQVQILSREGDTALSLAAAATQWLSLAELTKGEAEAQGAAAGHHYSRIRRQTPDGPQVLVPIPEEQVIAVVDQLLAAGADVNQANCSATPLMEAVRYGQLRLLAYLLERGSCPELPARDGQTALNIAKIYNQTRALTLLEAHRLAHSGDADVDSSSARAAA